MYIAASEWDGILVAREVIVKYSMDGEYLETVAERNYAKDNLLVNKHRFYGLDVRQVR